MKIVIECHFTVKWVLLLSCNYNCHVIVTGSCVSEILKGDSSSQQILINHFDYDTKAKGNG